MFWLTRSPAKYRRLATDEHEHQSPDAAAADAQDEAYSSEASHLLSASHHLAHSPPSVSLLFLCVAVAAAALLGLVVGVTLPSVDLAFMGISHRSLPLLGARLAVILHAAHPPPPSSSPLSLSPMSVGGRSRSPSEPEPALSVAPVCARSHVLPLAQNKHGWGVKMRYVVSNVLLCNVRLQNRSFFMTEQNWNYHSWTAGFLPPAGRLAPLLPGWDEPHVNLTEAVWQQLYWPPALSARKLQVVDRQGEDEGRFAVLQHEDGQDLYPASSLTPQPATASAFAFPFDTDCVPPVQSSLQHTGNGSLSNVTLNLPRPHLIGLMEMWGWASDELCEQIAGWQMPPDAFDFLFLSAPHHFGNATRRQQLGLALGDPRLPAAFLHPTRLETPPQHYLMSNRIWHQLAVLRPELRREVRAVLEQHGMRSRSQTHAWILSQLQAPRPAPGAPAPSSSSLPGAPFFGLHVRRQDKVEEANPLPASRYIASVERRLARDDQLRAALPLVACNGTQQPQPVVYIMTDAPEAAAEFPLLRPCWRFVIDPFGALIPNLLRTNESQWNHMPADSRLQQTRRLLLELTLLSEAEYAVMTGASNIAMIFTTNRGWVDFVWERRLRMLQ